MKLMLESTDELTEIDGVPVRVWRAWTVAGIECIAFVHRIAVAEGLDMREFDRHLHLQPPPRFRPLSEVLPVRQVV